MCEFEDEETVFNYPPTVQVKFESIKNGLFLLDNGLYLYLYIAADCNPSLLKHIFGRG